VQVIHALVTGGCGFIGSHFVRHLLQDDGEIFVTNLDLLTYAGNPDNLQDLEGHPRYRFLRGDVARPADVAQATTPCASGAPVTHIINFAAESHVDRSIQDASPFVQTNLVGVQVLADRARGLHEEGSLRCFLQVSTDEVYGALGEEGLFTEDSPLAPSSPYSAAKAGGDLLALAYHHTFGLPVVVTRCSNNYGPCQYPEKLIPRFVLAAGRDEPLPVYGTGRNVRDWIHVLDHVEGLRLALEQGRPGEVYNFGASNERTNLEITHTILRLTGKPESLIQFVTDRLGHDWRYAIDSSKVRAELGWQPRISFEEGMAQTVQWYQDHAGWIARLEARRAREGV
jgi:dTDP-glucose 4,6-dehydratase